MSNEIDSKIVAETLRELAYRYYMPGASRRQILETADMLNPPEPEIPDGHVWYRRDKNDPWTAGVCNGFDRLFNRFGNQFMVDNVEIVSAQTLAPEQVAVDKALVESAMHHLRKEQYFTTVIMLQAALDRDTEARR